jgi:hypothetical protein
MPRRILHHRQQGGRPQAIAEINIPPIQPHRLCPNQGGSHESTWEWEIKNGKWKIKNGKRGARLGFSIPPPAS